MSQLGNALVGQSGGPTAVINQTLVGVIEGVRAQSGFGRLYGAINGIRGILDGRLCDLGLPTAEELELVAGTPSSALLSVRLKADPEICRRIFQRFKQLDIRSFFYIGGNDTAETTHIIDELARADGFPLRCVHCPKTIDNDLRVTDHCPGYGSAAKFVAQAFMGDNLDNRSLGGIKINIIMGRDAGWLTAASVLARIFPDDGPHLVYCPEVDFDLGRFCADVEAVYRRLGRCVVAVSEGVHGPGHAPIIDLGEQDSHGNRQLSGSGALGDMLADRLKAHLARVMPGAKHRIRADTFGYLQRAFPGVISEVDAAEARRVGRDAVRLSLAAGASGSIAMRRVGEGAAYGVETFLTPLATVAKVTRPMPVDWIVPAGNDIVSSAFVAYAHPLVGKLPPIGQLPLAVIPGIAQA
jgi:6-phosphofructokinase 1